MANRTKQIEVKNKLNEQINTINCIKTHLRKFNNYCNLVEKSGSHCYNYFCISK